MDSMGAGKPEPRIPRFNLEACAWVRCTVTSGWDREMFRDDSSSHSRSDIALTSASTFAATRESESDEDANSEDELLNRDARDNYTKAPHVPDSSSSMREWIRMDSPAPDKIGAQVQSEDLTGSASTSKDGAVHRGTTDASNERAEQQTSSSTEYRVYKRRFFGLFQLVLLNIIVSWDVSLFLLIELYHMLYAGKGQC